jgi:kynurenine formamidase
MHIMDAHTGTHLVPPAYALPPAGFSNRLYSPEVAAWLAEYEKQFGIRPTSDISVEKVPLSQTAGWLRVIDVRSLAGKADRKTWPASPEITPEHINKFESANGALQAGEIVVFQTGQSERCVSAKGSAASACMSDPLNGRTEGWPTPGPATIKHLARKHIRAVGIDAPTLGGVEPRRALMTYWALGSEGMAGIEYLANLDQLRAKSYLVFGAVKIRGAHGAPGRALAFY